MPGNAHMQAFASFWKNLKRGYIGIYHHWSRERLHRLRNAFASRASMREMGKVDIIAALARHMVGRRLT